MHASCLQDKPLELSVIIPCYKEKDNVVPMLEALKRALEGHQWEVIFVDDNSPDGTIEIIRAEAQKDPRVRGISRVGRRGLSTAVIEGVLSSSAECVAVIDGDMQHDETRLPIMVNAVMQEGYDIAVGSRHVDGGDNTGLASRWRLFLSDTGIKIAQKFLPVPLNDPMSGFFLLKRSLFISLLPKLSGTGFKILLDLVMSSPKSTGLKEVPFCFRQRLSGESKLDIRVMIQFILMLVEKLAKGLLPIKLIAALWCVFTTIFLNFILVIACNKMGATILQGQIFGAVFSTVCMGLVFRLYLFKNYKKLSTCLFFLCSLVGIWINIETIRFFSITSNHLLMVSLMGMTFGAVWNMLIASNLVEYK